MNEDTAPDDQTAFYHANSGRTLRAQGDLHKALLTYQQALFFKPDWPEAYANLGEIYQDLGKVDEAALHYQQALALNPQDALTHYNFANALRAQGNVDEAIFHYQEAAALRPDLMEAYNNLGLLMKELGKLDEALAYYQHALTLAPDAPRIHNNLGALYHVQGELDKAITCYQQAITLESDYAEAHHNLGDALLDHGDTEHAARAYDAALSLNPDLDRTRYSKATLQLLQGDFAAGWQSYEARWSQAEITRSKRHYSRPLWQSEKLSAPLLIWGEQGIGDEIMFAGLLPDAIRTGNDIILDCANARLKPLFARSFPQMTVTAGETPDDFSAHLPIGSLPALFRPNANSFAATTSPYLVPDPIRQQEFRARYADGRPLIGLAWQSKSAKTGRSRSRTLAQLAPFFAAKNFKWVSLQYGDPDVLQAEINAAQAPVILDPRVDQLRDMDAFAAQIAALDLVITIDNATAHLAGALGVPTWVLLPFMPDWRWQLGRAGSPWYPTVRLFRQPTPDDWDRVITEIQACLNKL